MFEYFWDHVCKGCLDGFKLEEGRLPATCDELWSTACGAEFDIEDDQLGGDV